MPYNKPSWWLYDGRKWKRLKRKPYRALKRKETLWRRYWFGAAKIAGKSFITPPSPKIIWVK